MNTSVWLVLASFVCLASCRKNEHSAQIARIASVDRVSGECHEFEHTTAKSDGTRIVCRMMWCGSYTGGPATLWCDPAPVTPATTGH